MKAGMNRVNTGLNHDAPLHVLSGGSTEIVLRQQMLPRAGLWLSEEC